MHQNLIIAQKIAHLVTEFDQQSLQFWPRNESCSSGVWLCEHVFVLRISCLPSVFWGFSDGVLVITKCTTLKRNTEGAVSVRQNCAFTIAEGTFGETA